MRRPLFSFSSLTLVLLTNAGIPLLPISLGKPVIAVPVSTTQDRRNEAIRLNGIGLQQYNQGRFREALETFERALAFAKEIGDQALYGTTLYNIGSVYVSLGQYSKALDFYNQALAIAKEVGDQALYGKSLNNIGFVYRNLGQYAKALEFLNQALAFAKEIGDQAGYGTILGSIG
ncbi:tetratricopeptide repeat protein [Microcoleus sp. FACHB-68]|uniref:tetratricopeptide repeat protein n=1 Tax=Microcoleus sp. FACHB-68 TaxID=2692826 RepID=UPI001685BC45|nr:tetratricopeptide repeat protein [Microcoleus sp. FACHB-68]MBD1937578.1 tetratricopeptide repeat protein [Microcoleus sp. FACHB-68]